MKYINTKYTIALFLFLLSHLLNGQGFDYLPRDNSGNQLISHTYYTLSYSEPHEQPNWVAYMLTRDMVLTQTTKRTDDFREDPKVSRGSAQLIDYRGSGFDRGHLLPAGDMNFSHTAMSETFYMSNINPQTPSFNRCIWAKLEDLVRQWAVDYDTIYVVTEAVLDDELPAIGPNNVAVPKYYYKTILAYTSEHQKAIGFILPNEGSKADLVSFACSVETVENKTGIDFYHQLPDAIENKLESQIDASLLHNRVW